MPFWCSAPLNLLRLPLAWVLAFPLGPAEMWWARMGTHVLFQAIAKVSEGIIR